MLPGTPLVLDEHVFSTVYFDALGDNVKDVFDSSVHRFNVRLWEDRSDRVTRQNGRHDNAQHSVLELDQLLPRATPDPVN